MPESGKVWLRGPDAFEFYYRSESGDTLMLDCLNIYATPNEVQTSYWDFNRNRTGFVVDHDRTAHKHGTDEIMIFPVIKPPHEDWDPLQEIVAIRVTDRWRYIDNSEPPARTALARHR